MTLFMQPRACVLAANVGATALPKDEMQRIKQAQRLHKEDTLSPDEVAQPIDVSAEKTAQPVSRQPTMYRPEETPMTMDQ